MAQTDISPASNPQLGIHFHAPNGQSAAAFSNPSDAPVAAPTAGPTTTGKSVVVNVAGVRFASPS